MTLIQMQYFQAVCKTMSFVGAAEELHISQPAMSAAIRNLEQECGCLLFRRDKNALNLTYEGSILLGEVELILRQYQHLNHVVNDLSLTRKYVRVGLSTLSGNTIYPDILKEFKQRYPDIEVISQEESTGKQFELLGDGSLDVIITVNTPAYPQDEDYYHRTYGHWVVGQHRNVFCVSVNNPLAKEQFITIEKMAEVPLVLLKDNFLQTQKVKGLFAKAGIAYQVIHYTSHPYTIERFVERNVAAGFLPEPVAERNPQIQGIICEGFEDTMDIEIFWKKNRYMFGATKAFIDTAKEMYPKR